MPFIRESIITTVRDDGSAHIAPMGVHETDKGLMLTPFKPSATLDNLLSNGVASINYTDDVRVFAGCMTGRRDWPCVPTTKIKGLRLAESLSHDEVRITIEEEDAQRPRFYCELVHSENHAPFHGFNRAQSAVIELAILVSRLHMLAPEKIKTELDYLTIGLDKCAGERELEAWQWLYQRVTEFQEQDAK